MVERYSHDVIVCVHDALDDVRSCLESIVRCWDSGYINKLIIVDDCSGSDTARFLTKFSQSSEAIRLLRFDQQLFYTRAANEGLRASRATLRTLLNSDTVVTEGWSVSIQSVFERMPFVGIVGPLSNAASTQSLPFVASRNGQTAINTLPNDVSIDEFARFVRKAAEGVSTPLVPLVHGFCYTIHERVIDQIGYFAEDAFPMGYGEENDYSFRAEDAGFGLAIALDCYIFHSKSKSYAEETRVRCMREGEIMFVKRHGLRRRTRAIADMENHPSLIAMRTRVSEAWPEHTWVGKVA